MFICVISIWPVVSCFLPSWTGGPLLLCMGGLFRSGGLGDLLFRKVGGCFVKFVYSKNELLV